MGGQIPCAAGKTGLLWAVFTFFSYVCGVLGILYALTFILILTCRQAEGR